MKKTFRILAVAIFSIFMLSGPVLATPVVIDFEQGYTSGGTIATNLLSGSDIPLTVLKVVDQYGNLEYYNGTFNLNYDVTSGIQITGSGNITSEGDGSILMSLSTDEVLLYGTFSSYTANLSTLEFVGRGADEKSPALLRALGIPTDAVFAFLDMTGAYELQDGSLKAISVDVRNTQVPEPASLLLLGLGLLGIGIVSRKK